MSNHIVQIIPAEGWSAVVVERRSWLDPNPTSSPNRYLSAARTIPLVAWALEPAPCLNCGHPTRYRSIGGNGPLCHCRKECRGKPHPYGYNPREIDRALKAQSSRPGRQNWRNR